MTSINPQPETPAPPIIKPREGETLRSWLTRKKHALMFIVGILGVIIIFILIIKTLELSF